MRNFIRLFARGVHREVQQAVADVVADERGRQPAGLGFFLFAPLRDDGDVFARVGGRILFEDQGGATLKLNGHNETAHRVQDTGLRHVRFVEERIFVHVEMDLRGARNRHRLAAVARVAADFDMQPEGGDLFFVLGTGRLAARERRAERGGKQIGVEPL